MSTKDKIYELEVFSKFTEDSFCYHFKVDDTLEDRLKKYIFKDIKMQSKIFNLPIDDKEIKRMVSDIWFYENVENGFFHLQVEELMLHYSGEYRYLM